MSDNSQIYSASKHYFKKELRPEDQRRVKPDQTPPQSITLRRNFDVAYGANVGENVPPQSITLRRNFDSGTVKVASYGLLRLKALL